VPETFLFFRGLPLPLYREICGIQIVPNTGVARMLPRQPLQDGYGSLVIAFCGQHGGFPALLGDSRLHARALQLAHGGLTILFDLRVTRVLFCEPVQ